MDNPVSTTPTPPETQSNQPTPMSFHNGSNKPPVKNSFDVQEDDGMDLDPPVRNSFNVQEDDGMDPPVRNSFDVQEDDGLDDDMPEIPNRNDVFKFCKACNIFFNGPQTAKQHYAGKKHRKLEKEPISLLTCEVCNIVLSGEEQAKMHYQGKKHLKKLKQADKPLDAPVELDKQKAVEPCAKADLDILRSLYFSFKKFKYIKIEVATLEQLIDSKLKTELQCDVCGKKFNGKNPVVDHCNSKKHIQKVLLFKQKLHEGGIQGIDENVLIECDKRFKGTEGENGANSQELLDYDIEFSVQEVLLEMLNDISESIYTVAPSEKKSTVEPSENKPTIAPFEIKPTVTPPANKPTVTPPANKPAVAPPANKPAVAPPANKSTVASPANKPTVAPPANKPTVAPSANKPTVAPSANKPTVAPSANKPTVAPSANKPTVAPSANKPTVAPSANKPTVAPSANKPTVAPSANKPSVAPSDKNIAKPAPVVAEDKSVNEDSESSKRKMSTRAASSQNKRSRRR